MLELERIFQREELPLLALYVCLRYLTTIRDVDYVYFDGGKKSFDSKDTPLRSAVPYTQRYTTVPVQQVFSSLVALTYHSLKDARSRYRNAAQ